MNGPDETADQGGAPTGDGTGNTSAAADTGATDTSVDSAEANEGNGAQVQVEGDGNGTGQMGDDTNEGEEPPPVEEPVVDSDPVEAQADTDASGDEDEPDAVEAAADDEVEIVTVGDRDYTFDDQIEVEGRWYAALKPVTLNEGEEEGIVFLFLYQEAIGEGAEDQYLEVPDECLEAVNAAFDDYYSTITIGDLDYTFIASAEIGGFNYLALRLKGDVSAEPLYFVASGKEDPAPFTEMDEGYAGVVGAFAEIFAAQAEGEQGNGDGTGEEPPPVEAQADTDAPGDEDDGVTASGSGAVEPGAGEAAQQG